MGVYRKEWDCCDSVTETNAWEPEECPFCKPARVSNERIAQLMYTNTGINQRQFPDEYSDMMKFAKAVLQEV